MMRKNKASSDRGKRTKPNPIPAGPANEPYSNTHTTSTGIPRTDRVSRQGQGGGRRRTRGE